MEDLQKDLIEVLEKHGLKILKDSVELEFSPIHYNTMNGLSCREVALKFTEAVTSDRLIEYIERHGIIIRDD